MSPKNTGYQETAPVTITLNKILEIFHDGRGKKSTSGKSELPEKNLLGEGCDILYGNLSATSSPSLSRIRNCVSGNGQPYAQAYTAYERIADHYFSISSDDCYPALADLHAHITKAWETRLQHHLPPGVYEEFVENCSRDGSLKNLKAQNAANLQSFIKEFEQASSIDDRAALFTVLTILSVTRSRWHQIPAEVILPNNRTPKPQAVIENRYESALEHYIDQQYTEALALLENLEQLNIGAFGLETEDDLYRFNNKVFLLRMKVRRKLLQTICKSDEDRTEILTDIRYDLETAMYYHSPEAFLIAAREYLEAHPEPVYQPDDAKCKELCLQLLDVYPYAEDECGEAAWMLYQLEEDDAEADKYLKISAKYSYDKALKEQKKKTAVSLTDKIDQSKDPSCGFYIINDKNIYADMIIRSAPYNWHRKEYHDNNEEAEKGLHSHKRFFLISDDFERNLQELLHLLQTTIEATAEDFDLSFISPNEEHRTTEIEYEFYIRGQEEKISPIIDTALAKIENRIIPIHIIDDAKQSARLFAQHPLFYPIRRIKDSEPATLKLVVVGNTEVCEWLVREASWMLTFRSGNIKTETIVIAPDAESFLGKIRYNCPDIENIKPEIACWEHKEFLDIIDSTLTNSYVYFAVDVGSDIDNMSLATKIRECCIRKMIKSEGNVDDLPVISFRCQNPDIANLSLRTIVINENSGNKWFNNYSIIPFGRIDQHYHWDSLTNHIFERLSLNAHLQYYLKDEPESTADKASYFFALKDYYGRTYNRDSSMAVAMSLPYRLFQGIIKGRRILPPEPLDILNPDTFFSDEALGAYAEWVHIIDWGNTPYEKEFEIIKPDSYGGNSVISIELDPDSEVYKMSEWEQDRWKRFMISRGWSKASEKQMCYYYGKGNHSQQLYIGKVHPCLVDYAKLETINNKFKKLSGKDKGFHMSNITSILRTEKLLSLYWLEKARGFMEREAEEAEKETY